MWTCKQSCWAQDRENEVAHFSTLSVPYLVVARDRRPSQGPLWPRWPCLFERWQSLHLCCEAQPRPGRELCIMWG